jgi:hypothetical protein
VFDSKADLVLSCRDRERVVSSCRFRNEAEQEHRHSEIKVKVLRDSGVFAVIAIDRRLHMNPGDRNVTVDPDDRVE